MAIVAVRIPDFDVWRPSYAGASVEVLRPNTTVRVQVYSDPEATQVLEQPIVLDTRNINDVNYGKWVTPVYVTQDYYLRVNTTDETGDVKLPLLTLGGENGNEILVGTQRGSVLRRLVEHFDDLIFAADYGEIGGTPATNTATLAAAIGAAAGQGGGFVLLPEGVIQFTTLTLPANVLLIGMGRTATTLQSQETQKIIMLGGDRAGLMDLTLDGVNLNIGSIGVYGVGITAPIMSNVLIKRFDTGIEFRGVDAMNWGDVDVDNCEDGCLIKGDIDSGDSGDGGAAEGNDWIGGTVSNCTTTGLQLFFEDQFVRHNTFRNLQFNDNTGTALLIRGARYTRLENPSFSGNTDNIDIDDGSDTSQVALNTVIGFACDGGSISGGECTFAGTCQDLVFRETAFSNVDFTLTAPDNAVLLVDCTEDAAVTIAGTTLQLQRVNTHQMPVETRGVTTSNTNVTGWEYALPPGSNAYVEAAIVANLRNGEGSYFVKIGHRVSRPGSELAYDNVVGAFAVGLIVTGQTSGATGRIVADASSVLTLRTIDGVFEDNEQITDTATGDATVNGTLTAQNAALVGSQVAIVAEGGTDAANMDASFAVSVGNIQVSLNGNASETWDWVVRAEIILNE